MMGSQHIYRIYKGYRESPLPIDLRGLLYLQRALSNEFLLGGDGDEFFDHSGGLSKINFGVDRQ